ncbi:MAG: FAD-dependent oxidoreductase [Lachnospiraceae bacterium]|nr:FAD-dependent oxidoreductase [Lachnospiraceae bacterium]
MIRIQQLKLPITHTEQQLLQKAAKVLRIKSDNILEYKIRRQSVDARRKSEVSFVYTIDVKVKDQAGILRRRKSGQISQVQDILYQFPITSEGQKLKHPPVVIGSGPAGLFCAYLLAEHGFCPIILERGKPVEQRTEDVERFWRENVLDPCSNVQFGEGGAGTFSDGKLNTLVKDVKGRNQKVLEIFIRHGAPNSIAYEAKPHIGTDILKDVVQSMRQQIEAWGGKYFFQTCVTDLKFSDGQLKALICENLDRGTISKLETELAVLAVGHSARDTFEMLKNQGFKMEAKSFAVGLRVEHPQTMISETQYGPEAAAKLPAASYKVTANLENGRGVYSFCMCPGGYVVNASSEEERLAVNGMSYHRRDGKNANSAVIVTVTPEDFEGSGPLSGVAFQRKLEEKAYLLGKGRIPQQLFGDFESQKISSNYGSFQSEIKGQHTFGALHELFSEDIRDSFCQGMHQFARYIPDFDRADTILSGVESRTSSPVRITRNEAFESNKKGIYPCGEGAGYAGGILSAAMDGMKVAEAIAQKYSLRGVD